MGSMVEEEEAQDTILSPIREGEGKEYRRGVFLVSSATSFLPAASRLAGADHADDDCHVAERVWVGNGTRGNGGGGAAVEEAVM